MRLSSTLNTLHLSIPCPVHFVNWLLLHEQAIRLSRLVIANITAEDFDAVNSLVQTHAPHLRDFIVLFPGDGASKTLSFVTFAHTSGIPAPFDFSNCEALETLYLRITKKNVIHNVHTMLSSIPSYLQRLWIDLSMYSLISFDRETHEEPWADLDAVLQSPTFSELASFKLGVQAIDETDVAPMLPRCVARGNLELAKLTRDTFSRIANPGQALTLPKLPWNQKKYTYMETKG
jgi:hypothetical protein